MASKAGPISLAILDDYANVAPKHFQQIPNLEIHLHPHTLNPSKPSDLKALIERLQPYQVISSMRERTPFPATLTEHLPNLKLLLNSGNRNLALDLASFAQRGIPVTGTQGDRPEHPSADYEPAPPPGYSAVNQHAWALLLSLCGRVPQDDRALKSVPDAWQGGTGTSLGGKTIGLVGLGKLGAAMAKVAVVAFDMRVVAWSENLSQDRADEAAARVGLGRGSFRAVAKEELFRGADVVSCHLVLSDRTRGVVGRGELEAMGKGAVLVNTSRGGLIDEEALVECLKRGGIRGFATDVFWEEPLGSESVWRKVDEWSRSLVVLSPHMGYGNEGTLNRMYEEQAENLQRWLRGEELRNRMA